MNRVLYEVTATIHDQAVVEEWVRWMLDEHMSEVREGGAESARLVRIDNSPSVFSAQYEFPTRAALNHYLASHAPRLRAAGGERFEPHQVTYVRRSGEFMSA